MKINSHAHVFNLKAALTKEAVRVFISRLKAQDLPAYLTTPLHTFLKQVLDGNSEAQLGDENALIDILKNVAGHKDFQKIAGNDLGKELSKQLDKLIPVASPGESLKILEAVFVSIVKSSAKDAEKDARERTIRDFLEFLYINFLPSVDDVTDDLIAESGSRDVLVALPMDIIDENASNTDLAVYPKQLELTVRQALRYPGRILPFVKVNPRRGNQAYTIFKENIESGACVGVKLYPSLGYDVTDPLLMRVYRLCAQKEVPILLHCNDGGFRRSVNDAKKCNPAHWEDILSSLPKLKVCFGHFGGDEHLIQDQIPASSWTQKILDMMMDYPGQVYADIAFHTACMQTGAPRENYRKNIKSILNDSVCKTQVLWGSDYHLVRQQVRDSNYATFFERYIFSSSELHQIGVENPKQFLGLPDVDGTGAANNISRHVNYLNTKRDQVSGAPSLWLSNYLAINPLPLASNLNPLLWNMNLPAHWRLAQLLCRSDMYADFGLITHPIPSTLRHELATKYPDPTDLFFAIGQLRLGQLSYHFDNPGTENQLSASINAFVSVLQRLMTFNGKGKLNPEITSTDSKRELYAIAISPKSLISQLGNKLDDNYIFENTL